MFLLCAVIMLSSGSAPAHAGEDKSEGDVLTVGVPANRCPVFYKDPDTGKLAGIGVELMRIAAEKAGYSAVFL